jgi:hypothetical protein
MSEDAVGWLILGVYITGWLLTARRLCIELVDNAYSNPDSGDKIMGTMMSMITAVGWPLIVPGYLIYHTRPKKRISPPTRRRYDYY